MRDDAMAHAGKWCERHPAEGGPSDPDSGARAESTHEEDDQANQENQAEAAAADHRTTEIKTAAAEEKQKNDNEE